MVTRRQFIVGAALTSAPWANAVSSTLPGMPSGQARSGMTIATVAAGTRLLELPTADFSSVMSIPYPYFQGLQVSDPAPFRVSIEFDSRLFSGSDMTVVSCDGQFEAVPVAVALAEAPSPSVLAFEVPDVFDGATDAEVLMSLPLSARELYPNDGVADPLALRLLALDHQGEVLTEVVWAPTVAASGTDIWGASLTARWASANVVNRGSTKAKRYRYPQALLCTSVGPSDIPAGSQLVIDLDQAVISNCTVSDVAPGDWNGKYTDDSTTIEGALITVITLLEGVPAGTTLEIGLTITEQPGSLEVTSLVQAAAHLTGPTDGSGWQRKTGAYDTTDLTASGNALVARTAQGTS
ncbi:hypothetical protein ACQ3HE_00820 [Plantibacter auratus]|uniref:hypothetical protein n=1 Tax=Plantibacter auratus TaxID=272914 RepID=UPI003D336764